MVLQTPMAVSNRPTSIYTTSIQYNRIFSPTLLNELVASSHRSNHESGTLADDKNWPNELGFPNPFGCHGIADLLHLRLQKTCFGF